ncbi:MAG: arginine--tRNA ligase [Nanoarchaeota archaeon]
MKEFIAKLIKKILDGKKVHLTEEEILKLIEIPPSAEMGDYSFPCFSLASKLKQNPNHIAVEIKNKLPAKDFEEIRVVGAYVNFFIDKNKFSKDIVSEILKKKNNFGKPIRKENKKIVVEFSQPNTHKAFHVGHIRGTSLGESISRILEFCGNKVIRANYSGDTGMHVAKWIWCYKKYHSKEKLKNDESWIASIYVNAVRRLAENEKLQEEVNEINRKLENKEDKKLNELWKKTRKLSIDSWKKIYKELNTKFDDCFFESEVEKKAKEISLELLKKNIAKRDQGAIIMDFKDSGMGVWILLRSDGTVLYSAKDLALAEKKIKKYKADEYLVMVADEQRLHFEQLVKTLEIMKLAKKDFYDFMTFGLVRLPTGKMSSRTGDNILYSDFMNEIEKHVKNEIKKRGEKISEKDLKNRALNISIASIKYSMLKQGANKNIIFDKNEALNFEGDSGAYLLYSYARANSILKKTKKINSKIKIENLGEKEINLAKILSKFPEVVSNSRNGKSPSVIANYSHELAQKFNEFYHACPVINSENESFRIKLVQSFMQVMENSLNLLGINLLKRM